MVGVCVVAMAVVQNIEGGRGMAMKEATAQNPEMLNENLWCKYKGKHNDCCEYGDCEEPPLRRSEFRRETGDRVERGGRKVWSPPEVPIIVMLMVCMNKKMVKYK